MRLSPLQQLELFKGVQIVSSRKFQLPDGRRVNSSVFNVLYGGHTFTSAYTGWTTYSATTAFKDLLRSGNGGGFIHPDYWES